MGRLAATEFRLRKASDGMCPSSSAASGLLLDSLDAYADRDHPLMIETFDMGDRPQVAAVVPDSPAFLAGIRTGDDILAVDGIAVENLVAGNRESASSAEAVEKVMAASKSGKRLSVSLLRDGNRVEAAIDPEPLCSARLVLKMENSVDAWSDESNAAITLGLLEFARNDDEVALIAGHELAHIINRDSNMHKKGEGRSISARRQTEDRSDRLGANLAHCGGYDVDLALDFWERFRRRDWLGFLRTPTHRSVSDRIRLIREAIPTFRCPPARTS